MSLLLNRLYHLHWVSPEAARSAQPYLGFYARFLKSNRFKTVVNLRGENARYRWWRGEKKIASSLGIAHFDVKLSSRNIPSRASLSALFDAFEKGKAPILFKCSGGQDRSGLASSLFLLHRRGADALAEAQAQFALWPYLHRPKRHQRWLREFPAYAVSRAQGMTLAVWAREKYDPLDFAAYLSERGLANSYRTIQTEE
jgi:protein tyrosine/serine phosphatase